MKNLVFVLVGSFVCFHLAIEPASAQPKGFNYDEEKVPVYSLPDPLMTEDGEKVSDAEAWRKQRRPELLRSFEQHVYGAMPPALAIEDVEVLGVDKNAIGGKAVRKEVALSFSRNGKS